MPDGRIVLGEDDFDDEPARPAAPERPAAADAPTVRLDAPTPDGPNPERPATGPSLGGPPPTRAAAAAGPTTWPAPGGPGGPPPGGPVAGAPPAYQPRGEQRPGDDRPEPAGVGARVGGVLLDNLIIGIPAVILYVVVIAIASALIIDGIGDLDSDSVAAGFGLIVIVVFVLPLVVGLVGLLYVMLTMNRAGPQNGQTVGRSVAGIRLLRLDGRPVTGGTAFLHDLLYPFLVRLAIALPFLILIGVSGNDEPDYADSIFDDSYSYDDSASAGEVVGWIGWLLATCAWLGYVWWSMSRDPLRRTPYDKFTRSMTATSFSTPHGALGRPLAVPGAAGPSYGGPPPGGPRPPGPPGPAPAGPRAGSAPPAGQRPLWSGSSRPADPPAGSSAPPPGAGGAPLRLRPRSDD